MAITQHLCQPQQHIFGWTSGYDNYNYWWPLMMSRECPLKWGQCWSTWGRRSERIWVYKDAAFEPEQVEIFCEHSFVGAAGPSISAKKKMVFPLCVLYLLMLVFVTSVFHWQVKGKWWGRCCKAAGCLGREKTRHGRLCAFVVNFVVCSWC